jgi:hypothetical protein
MIWGDLVGSGVRTLAQARAEASERLFEVDEGVVDLERTAPQHDRAGDPDRLNTGVDVSEPVVKPPFSASSAARYRML